MELPELPKNLEKKIFWKIWTCKGRKKQKMSRGCFLQKRWLVIFFDECYNICNLNIFEKHPLIGENRSLKNRKFCYFSSILLKELSKTHWIRKWKWHFKRQSWKFWMLHLPLKHCHSAMFCQNEYGIKSLKIDDSYFHAFSIQTSSQSSVDAIATNKMAHNRTARLLVLLGIQAQTDKLHLAPNGSNCVHLGSLGSSWVYLGPLC